VAGYGVGGQVEQSNSVLGGRSGVVARMGVNRRTAGAGHSARRRCGRRGIAGARNQKVNRTSSQNGDRHGGRERQA